MNNSIGKNLKNMLQNSMCHPERVLFALVNNKGFGGFHLLNVISTNKHVLGVRPRTNIKPRLAQGLGELGKGAEGFAFIGCLDTGCTKMVVIKVAKNGLKHEYLIMTKIQGLSPHIPVAYLMIKCKERELLYEQYANGGDCIHFLKKYKPIIQPIHIKTIVFQILWTLYIIQQKYPTFRHNDLHMGNVLLDLNFKNTGGMKYKTDKTTFWVPNIGITSMINDFGFTNMTSITNPKVNSRYCKNSHGICTDNNSLYDVHFFLNSLYIELGIQGRPSVIRETKTFIESIFSPSYLGTKSNKISEGRLNPVANHTALRPLVDILEDQYFAPFHFKKTVAVANKPKKTVVPRTIVPNNNKPKGPNMNKVLMYVKKKSPVQVPNKAPSPVNRPCGKKARPKEGYGAERLTTDEMIKLIKHSGKVVPSDKSRDSLCAVIKQHTLNAPAELTAFLKAQNVTVIREEPVTQVPVAPVPVAQTPVPIKKVVPSVHLTNNALWRLKKKKLTNEIYNKMNKNNGNYQNRMNRASNQAAKLVRNMKKLGEKP